MLTGKTNKVHSAPTSQTKVPQQHCQQSDLQHLSLLIQQFSSQLNLMLSQQQQQQKHSDIGINDSTIDKQEQQTYSRHLQCPGSTSHFPPEAYSHSNSCYNTIGSFSKSNNQCHCHSAYISPSLSTLFPLQHQHAPTCMHDPLYRNHHLHSPRFPHCYDDIPPPAQTIPMMCYCHSSPHQCTATKPIIPPSVIDTSSPDTPVYATTSTMTNPIDQYASMTCPPPPPRLKSKSQSDPLPPLPAVDKEVTNDQDHPFTPHTSSSCTSADDVTCDIFSPTAQPPITGANVSQDHHHQISWTDLYRQDLLAQQDTLLSSYNNILSDDQVDNSNGKKKGIKKQSDRSHLRGWWVHGKYKWTQLRKKSIFVSG